MELPDKKQIANFQEKIRRDPVFFVEKILGSTLWEKQKEILEALRDNPEVAVRSCHASGKSYIAGRAVHWWLNSWNDSVVITTAPTYRQVKQVLWREIKGSVIGKQIYPESAILDTSINISPQWFALGLSTDRPDQFQGFHSPHLLIIIDEASGIPAGIEEAIDGLTPERILRIGQPLQTTGRFADCFRFPNVKKMQISAFDTPNLRDSKVVIPGLISAADVLKFKSRYGEDSDVYRVRILGEFPKAEADCLISVDDIFQAIQRQVEVPSQFEKKMGCDVARFGNDRSAIIVRQMEKVVRKEVFSGMDTMELTGKIIAIAKEEMVLPQNINVDSIGVGGGVIDRLKEQGWNVVAVNVAESATDKENYLNLRAELYAGKLKEWIKTASLPDDDDFYELANIKYKFNSNGKMQIESKEDMKKRGLNSPDVSDALMLTLADKKPLTFGGASPLAPTYSDSRTSEW